MSLHRSTFPAIRGAVIPHTPKCEPGVKVGTAPPACKLRLIGGRELTVSGRELDAICAALPAVREKLAERPSVVTASAASRKAAQPTPTPPPASAARLKPVGQVVSSAPSRPVPEWGPGSKYDPLPPEYLYPRRPPVKPSGGIPKPPQWAVKRRCRAGRTTVPLRGKPGGKAAGKYLFIRPACRTVGCPVCYRNHIQQGGADNLYRVFRNDAFPDHPDSVSDKYNRARKAGESPKPRVFAVAVVDSLGDGWDGKKKAINRAKGNYAHILTEACVPTSLYKAGVYRHSGTDGPRRFIVATFADPDAIPDGFLPMTPAEAAAFAYEAIDHIPKERGDGSHPVVTSKRWLKPKPDSEYTPELALEAPVEEIAETAATVGIIGSPGDGRDDAVPDKVAEPTGSLVIDEKQAGGAAVVQMLLRVHRPNSDGTRLDLKRRVNILLTWLPMLRGKGDGPRVRRLIEERGWREMEPHDAEDFREADEEDVMFAEFRARYCGKLFGGARP